MIAKYIFTADQEKFIADNYLLVSIKDISRKFGVDSGVISRYYKRLGLVVPIAVKKQFRINKMIGRTSFTPDQDVIIKNNYLTVAIKPLGNMIGKSYTGVMCRLRQLGLAIPAEVIERNRISAQIKPGNVPANKGKKQVDYMDAETIARTAATRFKKGNIPFNTKEADGEISIRHDHPDRNNTKAYKYIRISLGVWKQYHHYLWEQVNGKVPKGHCLWFKDGDSLNCELGNLELITRKENRLRNASWAKMDDHYIATTMSVRQPELRKELLNHPDLLSAKRNQLLINRKIKQHGTEQNSRLK